MLDVDILKIDWDEDGCYLILSAEDDTLRVRLTDPEQAYDAVKAGIGPWLAEKESAFAEFRQAVRSGTGPAAAFLCSPEDVDESGGYALSDPKHPDFHSVHSDIWDAREGK